MKTQKLNVPKKKSPVKKIKQPEKQLISKRNTDLIGAGIIALLGIIIYSNSFGCSFHLDDLWVITNNKNIQDWSDVKSWWEIYPSRAIVIFTFTLNYYFSQLNVWSWHFVNLLIHIINGFLVWQLSLQIFSTPAIKDHPISNHKKILSLLTALLFISHPLATQSVTYIVQRMNSMMAMFYFLSIIFYIKARVTDQTNKFRYIFFGASFISMVLAMFCKENAFTIPLAFVLFEIFFLQTKKFSINFKDFRVLLSLAAFFTIVIFLFVKFAPGILKTVPPECGNTFSVTPQNYLFTQFGVILKYIQLLILPINQNLDYDWLPSNNFFEIKTLLSFIAIVALIALAIYLFNRNRIISFGIFWFFLTLSVESSIIPLTDLIFEHRTYLPSFGFFLILSSGIYFLFWKKYKYQAIAFILFIIAINSLFTYNRNKVWKDEISLWTDVIVKSPNKARPYVNRSFAYQNLGQYELAFSDNAQAIKLSPNYSLAWYNRGVYYKNMQQFENSISDLSRAISIDPKYVDAYFNRGAVYSEQGKWDKALADFSMGIKYDPENADLYSNRGIVYGNQGQWDKAVVEYSKAISFDPLFADNYSNRGAAYASLGLYDKAVADLTKAIEINPKYDAAYTNRGFSYSKLGQWEKAISDYNKALEINPNNNVAYSQRELANQNLNVVK